MPARRGARAEALSETAAIENVYEEAVREDKDAGRVNPMALWDLH